MHELPLELVEELVDWFAVTVICTECDREYYDYRVPGQTTTTRCPFEGCHAEYTL